MGVEYLYRLGHRQIALVPRILSTGQLRFYLEDWSPPAGAEVHTYPLEGSVDWGLAQRNIAEAMGRAIAEFQPTAWYIGPDLFPAFGLDYQVHALNNIIPPDSLTAKEHPCPYSSESRCVSAAARVSGIAIGR